ncbi:MAG: hypothetical protein PF542_01140 [Nanoarchaeota archaeon]|nr:hypothetical protein [Nanoarchaeota archaeon]
MTQLIKYGFIFKGPWYKETGEINKMNSSEFSVNIVAVPSIESACIVAK